MGLINWLNKIQEGRQEGLTLKDFYNYYKMGMLETSEEKEKRLRNSIL